eukprot:tig00020710_g13325.t1
MKEHLSPDSQPCECPVSEDCMLDDLFSCCDALGPECDCDCIPLALPGEIAAPGDALAPNDGLRVASSSEGATCIKAHGSELHWHFEENHAFFADSGCVPALCPGDVARFASAPSAEDALACELEGHHHAHHQHQPDQPQLFVPTETLDSLSGVIFPGCSLGPAVQCWSSHAAAPGCDRADPFAPAVVAESASPAPMDLVPTGDGQAPTRSTTPPEASPAVRPHHHHIIHHHHPNPFRTLSISDSEHAPTESSPPASHNPSPSPVASCSSHRLSASPTSAPALCWQAHVTRPGKRKTPCTIHSASDSGAGSPSCSPCPPPRCPIHGSAAAPAKAAVLRPSPFACPVARAESPRMLTVRAAARRESLAAGGGGSAASTAAIVSSASSMMGSTPSSGDEATAPASPAGRPPRSLSSPTPSDATDASSLAASAGGGGGELGPRRRGRRPRSMMPDPASIVPLAPTGQLSVVFAPLEPGQSGPSEGKRRLVWTTELHDHFVRAVEHLGIERATPKAVLSVMGIEDLRLEHIKSHLQKYRVSLRKGLEYIADENEEARSPLGEPASAAAAPAPAQSPRAAPPAASGSGPSTPSSTIASPRGLAPPPPPPQLPPPPPPPQLALLPSDPVSSRLAELERQLEAERRARTELQAALDAERKARAAVEGELARHRQAALAAASLLATTTAQK